MTSLQDPPRLWFISDTHHGHESVISHCKRPFANLREMERTIQKDWNERVKTGDRVFVIGDFSFYEPAQTSAVLWELNGQKTLIKGNHDHPKHNARVRGWSRIEDYLEIRVGEEEPKPRIVMSHFPFLSWHQMHRGAYHLHGHSHGSLKLPERLQRARILDVGVDHLHKLTGHWGPISWEEIQALMAQRTAASTDHHTLRDPEFLYPDHQQGEET